LFSVPACLCLLLAGASSLAGAHTDVRLIRWNDLPAAVGQSEVVTVLRNGERLHGRVTGVQSDFLLLEVVKSPDKKKFSPGQQSVPRRDVVEVRRREIRGPYRALLAGGGGAGLFFASLPWAMSERRANVSDTTRIAQNAAIAGAGAIAGYFAGRALDSQETVFRFETAAAWRSVRRRSSLTAP
jgi:hypothetical protein